jgi:hypothetical protein
MNDIPSILTDVTISKSDEFLTLSREIMELSYNRISSLEPSSKRPRMELPPDPHRVLPIKRLAALLRAASDRAHFSYLLRGCLLVDLRGGAVVGPQQLPADIEAVWVLLYSVETIVAPIG